MRIIGKNILHFLDYYSICYRFYKIQPVSTRSKVPTFNLSPERFPSKKLGPWSRPAAGDDWIPARGRLGLAGKVRGSILAHLGIDSDTWMGWSELRWGPTAMAWRNSRHSPNACAPTARSGKACPQDASGDGRRHTGGLGFQW
jgi:hypothetical protein